MDFRFVAWLRTAKEERLQSELNRIEEAGPAARLPSVIMRKSDEETFRELEAIVKEYAEQKEYNRGLQRASVVLSSRKSVNTILMSVRPSNFTRTEEKDKTSLMCGAPAKYLTAGEVIEFAKKQKEQEEEA